MWWHFEAYRLMGLAPSVDPGGAAAIDAIERETGLLVPAAVREWYSVPGAASWLEERRGNEMVAVGDLGAPLDGIDYLARARLAVETDCQYCCRWVIRLRPPLPDDDPPVFLADPEDSDSPEQRYADRFSAYVLTSVWDANLAAGAVSHFYHPLPPRALDILRQRYAELPVTFAYSGNEACDAVYRFAGDARIMIVVKGQEALCSVVDADTARHQADVLTVLGLRGS